MHRILRSLGIATALFAGSVCAATPDETAIRAQTTSWVAAYNASDLAGVMAQYADDAVVMPPNAPGMKGSAAIKAFFVADLAASKSADAKFVIDQKTDVGVVGTTGWESGVFRIIVKGAVVETGKFLSVSVKKNGKWKYYRDIWNADAAAPTPAK